MSYIRTSVVLHPNHLSVLDDFLDNWRQGRSAFIRHCINYYFENADEETKKKFLGKIEEAKKADEMRRLIEMERVYRDAFKVIRRSGYFIDQVRGKVSDSYPKGILENEKKAISLILYKREQLAKELTKYVSEAEKV